MTRRIRINDSHSHASQMRASWQKYRKPCKPYQTMLGAILTAGIAFGLYQLIKVNTVNFRT